LNLDLPYIILYDMMVT